MKSRISFFDAAVFKKNITRFAPVWALYTLFLLLGLLVVISGGNYFAVELSYVTESFAIINLPYALICALLLFGDLYNTRMCNAIHAMPVRRETLFVTNLLSGLSFSVIPTLAVFVIALPFSILSYTINGFLAPLLTFAAANLQYLFFFGTAVLCAFLAGNRFAMALLYGIINFWSLLAFWFVDTLYTPMLYGLKTLEEPFSMLCPLSEMMTSNYVDFTFNTVNTHEYYYNVYTLTPSDGWGYVGICAAIGLAFMGLALLLYRRRKLECAGDFLAFRQGEPVFLTVYSLVMGAMFQFLWSIFLGDDVPVLLFIGLMVGFFTGRMLLKRTVRVFRLKAFAGCSVLMLAMGLSLIMTVLDPIGIQSWMPEANEVKSVTLYQNHSLNNSPGNAVTLENPEDIEAILSVHRSALDQDRAAVDSRGWVRLTPYDEMVYFEDLRSINIALEYRMKNGTVVRRYYNVWVQGQTGDILKEFFTRVECVLGVPESELPELAQELDSISMDAFIIHDKQAMLSLLQAIAADCNAGTMAQNWAFRDADETWENIMDIHCTRHLDRNTSYWYYIQVFAENENILNWMNAHSVPTYQDMKVE